MAKTACMDLAEESYAAFKRQVQPLPLPLTLFSHARPDRTASSWKTRVR